MTDYYVDSDVGGPGAGTLGDPWDDIASNINSLNAGDTMYLRGNVSLPAQAYAEAEIDISVSGTDGSPIAIMPYNSELVTIQTTGGSKIFDIDADWIVIDDLDLDGNAYDAYAVRINADADDNIIRNCVIHETGSDGAITITGGNDNTIDNCVIYDTFKANDEDSHGVLITRGFYNVISNCTIYDCRGDCVQTEEAGQPGGGTQVLDSELYTTLDECSENAVDLKLGDADVQSIIRGNTIYGFRYCDATCGGSGGGTGAGILIHDEADNVLIEDNEIYDCASGITANDVDDIIIRRNTIHNLVLDGASWLCAPFYIFNCDNVQIYNNTVEDDAGDDSIYLANPLADVVFRNNIFSNCGDITGGGLGGVSADYTCWHNCVGTIAGAHDVNDNPDFTNPGTNDYTLQAVSPCIDAGVYESPVDYYFDSAPDMGAFEYTPSLPGETIQIIIWRSDGAGEGDDGDLMAKATVGGVTRVTTLSDYSEL